MNLKLIIFIAVFFTFQALAAPLTSDGFHKRFELLKNDEGKVIAIKDKSLRINFSILTFINALRRELHDEKRKMVSKGNYFNEAQNILFENNPYVKTEEKGSGNRFAMYMMGSLHGINGTDIDSIFDNPKFQEVLFKFEDKLKSLMMSLRLDLVANMENPKYFYKRNVGYQAVRFGLNLARRKLSSIPLLNTASDIIVKMEKLIRETRTYHQNILLYYLHNFEPEELGLTKELADYAFSSIYESRIPVYFFWESNTAAATWDHYGTDKFYAGWRMATNRLRGNRNRYDTVGERLNFAFSDATFKANDVIVNLVDNESIIQWYPAVSYDYNRPNYVKRKRELLRLVQVGMSFITVPAFFKDLINKYIDSTHVNQRLTEGSLYAHFEATGMGEMRKRMVRQTMNPFETLE